MDCAAAHHARPSRRQNKASRSLLVTQHASRSGHYAALWRRQCDQSLQHSVGGTGESSPACWNINQWTAGAGSRRQPVAESFRRLIRRTCPPASPSRRRSTGLGAAHTEAGPRPTLQPTVPIGRRHCRRRAGAGRHRSPRLRRSRTVLRQLGTEPPEPQQVEAHPARSIGNSTGMSADDNGVSQGNRLQQRGRTPPKPE